MSVATVPKISEGGYIVCAECARMWLPGEKPDCGKCNERDKRVSNRTVRGRSRRNSRDRVSFAIDESYVEEPCADMEEAQFAYAVLDTDDLNAQCESEKIPLGEWETHHPAGMFAVADKKGIRGYFMSDADAEGYRMFLMTMDLAYGVTR